MNGTRNRLSRRNIAIRARNITHLIKQQHKMYDEMYLEALETNYTHEHMTPLNNILNSSQVVQMETKSTYDQLINAKYPPAKRNNKNLVHVNKLLDKQRKIDDIANSVFQSGKMLFFFNSCQIQRLKIRRNQFEANITANDMLDSLIREVVDPFDHQMKTRGIRFSLFFCFDMNLALKQDWKKYQLILFNIVQNAVKFNNKDGEVVIVLKLIPKIKVSDDLSASSDTQSQIVESLGIKKEIDEYTL